MDEYESPDTFRQRFPNSADNKPMTKAPPTKALYNYLRYRLGVTDREIDQGYPVVDYHQSRKVDVQGAGDGKKQDEEVWETTLRKLDVYGSMAHWKEDLDEASDESERGAIIRYQKFRRFVETTTGRSVPWVLETPYVGIKTNQTKSYKKYSRGVRQQSENLSVTQADHAQNRPTGSIPTIS